MDAGGPVMEDEMPRMRCVAVVTICLYWWAGSVCGQTSLPLAPQAVSVHPAPEEDDATLHDVQLVGERHGWAVGDRGGVWKTTDGGKTWLFSKAPVECSLRSVCFLTDRIGWIAGGGIAPHARHHYGVVLATQDGGETWKSIGPTTLPYAVHVQFFDLDHGVCVCEPTARRPSGVLITEDGGTTWTNAEGVAPAGWRAAAFVDSSTGYVGGLRGEHAGVSAGSVRPRPLQNMGLSGIHALTTDSAGRRWMGGDGALLLMSETAGATWQDPVGALPGQLREFFDIRAIAAEGDMVWAAGSPGGVIWHSIDGGRSWEPLPTGDPTPISAIDFASPDRGCAVGPFGKILVTEDGGYHWTAARAGGRRLALLVLAPDSARTPLQLLTQTSGEQGYRSAVALTARRDVGPDGHLQTDIDLRLHDAVVAAGGCETEFDWRLPISLPGLDDDYDRLVEHFSQATDGKLPDVMLGRVVAQLRTYRPEVLVLDAPAGDGAAAGKLLNQAILFAVEQAADETRFADQIRWGGLQPWTVQKVFARLPTGDAGTVMLNPHTILPGRGMTVSLAADAAVSRLHASTEDPNERQGFRLIHNSAGPVDSAEFNRGLFSGLHLPAGGDARRAARIITQLNYDELEHRAQHQRNFAEWSRRALGNERAAAQLIAQLSDIVGNAPDEQAALQLADLAEQYKAAGRWQLAEDTSVQLVQRYPREPVAVDAMRWLLKLWTSQEMGWSRLQNFSYGENQVTVDGKVARENVERTRELLERPEGLERLREMADSPNSPLLIQPVGGDVTVAGRSGHREEEAGQWYEKASRLADALRRIDPVSFEQPDVQFTYAALLRHRREYERSDEIYRGFFNETDPLWQQTARGEVWALHGPVQSPKPVFRCRTTAAPPVLDGVLSDSCWQEAEEVYLEEAAAASDNSDQFIGSDRVTEDGSLVRRRNPDSERALVMLAHDEKYLYFAATVPRREGQRDAPVQLAGREHDADLTGFDRLSLQLDVDRDYATWYRFDVDSRGRTREACWINQAWNPAWYLAAQGDSRRWTIEAAIPLEALVPAAPGPRATWSIGISRIMPAEGVQSWTQPAGSVPRGEAMGLLRFE
ncbi:MAG: hypothetical protein DWQ29_00535 [Planctomycetota bacterium]|nr:MAG: hypothetical protein DWQ29_00535 [Planctomycetota bacterium]